MLVDRTHGASTRLSPQLVTGEATVRLSNISFANLFDTYSNSFTDRGQPNLSYFFVPEDKKFEKIFLFEGFNIATTLDAPERCPTCFDKQSREVSAYRKDV